MAAARFARRREDFTCAHCDAQVQGNGYTNHCPHCLWSRHVDVHPGDRAASCGALMEPVAALSQGGETVVIQRCTGCGHVWRNRAADNDRTEVLLALSSRPFFEESARPRWSGRPR